MNYPQVPHSQKICILNSIIRIFNSGIFLFDSDRGSFCPGISNTIYSFVLVVKGQEGLRSSQQSIPESCFTFCGFPLRAHPMKWAALPEFMRKHTLESICVFGKVRFIWCQAILPRRSELEEPTLPTESPAPCGQATAPRLWLHRSLAPHWNKLPGTPDCPQWGNRLLKDELDANCTVLDRKEKSMLDQHCFPLEVTQQNSSRAMNWNFICWLFWGTKIIHCTFVLHTEMFYSLVP